MTADVPTSLGRGHIFGYAAGSPKIRLLIKYFWTEQTFSGPPPEFSH